MLTALLIPAVVLLVLSSIATGLVLRTMLRGMSASINQLNEISALMLRGDLEIEVPTCKESEELETLFREWRVLNEINKYSEPKYFAVPKPERIIRYLRAFKLFEKYKYNPANLCESLADCYLSLGDIPEVIKFLHKAVDEDLYEYRKKNGEIEEVFKEKTLRKRKLSKESNRQERNMIRRIVKLTQYLYYTLRPGDSTTQAKIAFNIDIAKKIAYPKILCSEYLEALILELRIKSKFGQNSEVEENLRSLKDLVHAYEDEYQGDPENFIPPDIIISTYQFIKAEHFSKEGYPLEAYEMYVRAL